jgi:hypothetical protein
VDTLCRCGRPQPSGLSGTIRRIRRAGQCPVEGRMVGTDLSASGKQGTGQIAGIKQTLKLIRPKLRAIRQTSIRTPK